MFFKYCAVCSVSLSPATWWSLTVNIILAALSSVTKPRAQLVMEFIYRQGELWSQLIVRVPIFFTVKC